MNLVEELTMDVLNTTCNRGNNSFQNEYFNDSVLELFPEEKDHVPGAAVMVALTCMFISVEILASQKTKNAVMKARDIALNSVELININNADNHRTLADLVTEKTLLRCAVFIVLVILSPVVVLFLIMSYVYKIVCLELIKRRDTKFVKGLDSFDVFWSLEDEVSKSIINVLGIIQSENSQVLVDKIKDKLKNITCNTDGHKIFYKRNNAFGFYYWTKDDCIDLDDYVQLVDLNLSEGNENYLEAIMTKVANEDLPHNDTGLFQILITKQSVHVENETNEYGIIFRIHHSVGDGVALIEFLCSTLADEKDKNVKLFKNPATTHNKIQTNYATLVKNLIEMPMCFIDGIIRKPDDSSLHGPKLNGNKVFSWTNSGHNLFSNVKDLKRNLHDGKFSDILAVSLANGLNKFYEKASESIPENVAVVLPVRFPKTQDCNQDIKLENDFSVTILDLPVGKYRNMRHIKQCCDNLRTSADPLTNYYFLKLVGGVLPKQILQPLLNSSQATMVFSNMPGPETMTLCGGRLKELIFFVPHKGTTGLGVTALCYGGELRFGAMADSALVSSSEHLSLILQGMVDEIQRLYDEHVH